MVDRSKHGHVIITMVRDQVGLVLLEVGECVFVKAHMPGGYDTSGG
jgi:hypothetical protein